MKRLIIVTRKEKLDAIKKLIQEKYACGMTVTQVEGVGNQADFKDSEGVRLGKDNQLNIILMPKVRIEAVVKDDQAESLIEDVCAAARTGRFGDGEKAPARILAILVDDDSVEQVVETVLACARTGKVGDGKIFIHDVLDAIRIRTGERGEDALNTTYRNH